MQESYSTPSSTCKPRTVTSMLFKYSCMMSVTLSHPCRPCVQLSKTYALYVLWYTCISSSSCLAPGRKRRRCITVEA